MYKNPSERKLVRVPAMLKQNVEAAIYKSRTVLANCPFGHDVRVEIKVEYIPKNHVSLDFYLEIERKRTSPGPRLVQSDEPFSEEHFDLLLRSPLQEREKRFVRFFQKRMNEPMSPLEWRRSGFPFFTSMREINFLCRHHRLGVTFAETGEYDTKEGVLASKLLKYKFYVLEKARKVARE